jgi:hypothetical protein
MPGIFSRGLSRGLASYDVKMVMKAMASTASQMIPTTQRRITRPVLFR